MISIVYTTNNKIIKSQDILHIYDFGSSKGFLKNTDFTVYKILYKEMKDASLYEECEISETIPLNVYSIESYEYIENGNQIDISNFSIEFKPQQVSSLKNTPSVSKTYSQQPSSLPQQPLFDQSQLMQIYLSSNKVYSTEPTSARRQMIPLGQVSKGPLHSLSKFLRQ